MTLKNITEVEAGEYAEKIVATVREPLIVLDNDLKVISANKSFYQTFKVDPERTQGQFIYDLGDGEWNIPKLRSLLEDVLPQNDIFENYEVEHDFKTIGPKIMLLNARRLDGMQKILLAIEDITERKHAEESIKDAAEVRTRFASMVTHEIGNPLATIQLALDGLLNETNATDVQRRSLDIAKRSIDRLNRLTRNILDYQKMILNKTEFDMKENDINKTVGEACEGMALLGRAKGLDLVATLDEKLPKIAFDKDKIIQVLVNLLNNAIKFTDKGRISVVSRRDESSVHISVQDTGDGIASKDMGRLFKTFEKLNTDRDGTGLGLAISKEIILAHNGKIWAESELGKGTTVHFTLPV